jgi:hypothetical protein
VVVIVAVTFTSAPTLTAAATTTTTATLRLRRSDGLAHGHLIVAREGSRRAWPKESQPGIINPNAGMKFPFKEAPLHAEAR